MTFVSTLSWGYLGGSDSSIETDFSALAGKSLTTVSSSSLYTVKEISLGRTKVREYLSPTGTVFGIGWSGPHPKNLGQLLGNYASLFVSNRTEKTFRRTRSSSFKNQGLVVETWGPQRNLKGRAYFSDLIPVGVNPNAID